MSSVPLQGNEILVDTPSSASGAGPDGATNMSGMGLVSWIVTRINVWESVRERGYGRLWAEYWRAWRGKWAAIDQTRNSERSRIITPALAQAIEATVSEIEEAVFGKDVWFDIPANVSGPLKPQMQAERDQLRVDLDKVNVKDAVTEAVLNGAITGQMLLELNVQVVKDQKPVRDPHTLKLAPNTKERVQVIVESIRPDQFVPDPSAQNISEMLGYGIIRVKPQHLILERIKSGLYRKDALPFVFPQHRMFNRDIDKEIDPQSILTTVDADEAEILEYHGKVPLGLLNDALEVKSPLDEILQADKGDPDLDSESYVEAIVTIANRGVLLRAMVNPFVMQDRPVIAAQFEKVPGRFWGRGAAEKGINAQRGLDAIVRSYIDALGYVGAPMLGVDAGRIPRGFKMEVHPGKVWTTQGPPQEILSPVKIGEVDPALFQTASEMERMVQMGTGAFDTAAALNNQSQSGANSLSSNSMLMGAFVKRSKRAVQNVSRNLLTPMLTKALWRYMQFDPVRYPQDFDFEIRSTMGIMAREVEAMQLTQLMGMLGDEMPQAKLALLAGIIDNSAVSNKAQIMQVINSMINPSPQQQQQQQQMQQLQMEAQRAEVEAVLLKNQLTIAQIRQALAIAMNQAAQGGAKNAEVIQEQMRLGHDERELENQEAQTRIAAMELPIKHMQATAALISAKSSGSKNSESGS